jgi:hypothetical protein
MVPVASFSFTAPARRPTIPLTAITYSERSFAAFLETGVINRAVFKNQLHDAGTVAEINKNNAPLIPALLHPAHQGDFFSDLLFRNFSAAMGPLHTFHGFRHACFLLLFLYSDSPD